MWVYVKVNGNAKEILRTIYTTSNRYNSLFYRYYMVKQFISEWFNSSAKNTKNTVIKLRKKWNM